MLTSIVGINWGDEGKGRMVDLFSDNYDVICRYQGGNNAGHTVVNSRGTFVFNLLPSGILRDGVVNVLGNGMVIDIEHLANEIAKIQEQGVEISPTNLKISEYATICMPYHKLQDCLEEDRLADKKFGSTRRGIAPAYADKYLKKSIRMCDLQNFSTLKEKLNDIVAWKNIVLSGYDAKIDAKEMFAWLEKFGKIALPFICSAREVLLAAHKQGKNIMFEAQLGALKDIDHGIFPFTSSSTTLASYATTGTGVPELKLTDIIGIMKAYSSCVGEGPFVAEDFTEFGQKLREAGNEYGSATGRPRRVGGFDIPASKYGAKMQGATALALTKLDTLSGLGDLPVIVAYDVNGTRKENFVLGDDLARAKPIIQHFKGFDEDISKCRNFEELPKTVQDYVNFIENAVETPIKYISVGAERDSIIVR